MTKKLFMVFGLIFLVLFGYQINAQVLKDGENVRILGPNQPSGQVKVVLRNTAKYFVSLKVNAYNLPDKSNIIGTAKLLLEYGEVGEVNIDPLPGKRFENPIYVDWSWKSGDYRKVKNPNGFLIPISNTEITICQSPDGPLTTHTSIPDAIDFCAPLGAALVATKDGIITVAIDNNTEGGNDPKYASKANRVFILHDDGSISAYDHLAPKSIPVKEGQFVKKGDAVGRIGLTGQTSGPHLHFAVIYYDSNGEEQYLHPKFVSASNKEIPISYRAIISTNGDVRNTKTQSGALADYSTSQSKVNKIYRCINDGKTSVCDSTKLSLADGVLKEYKGTKLWATFRGLQKNENSDDLIFFGIDDSRGALLKIESTVQKNSYKVYWGWKQSDLSKIGWNLVTGIFVSN